MGAGRNILYGKLTLLPGAYDTIAHAIENSLLEIFIWKVLEISQSNERITSMGIVLSKNAEINHLFMWYGAFLSKDFVILRE
jgi:hypothetical protein